jgi:two-component system, OmpR family, KDP operon response regulator KdpE
MPSHEVTVLAIEDEPEIRRFLRTALPQHGYRLYETSTGQDGLAQSAARNPDIILLDLGLPDLDGLAVIRRLREWATTPIIVLSARDQEKVKVTALDLGADDYLTKPFGIDELLARMRVVLRHAARASAETGETVFTTGALRVDLQRRQVFVSEKEVHLTPIEYKLLIALVRSAGKVLTHRQLLKEVWGPLHVDEAQYLRGYMRQLRNKLEANPTYPRYLVTELGVGYRLRED